MRRRAIGARGLENIAVMTTADTRTGYPRASRACSKRNRRYGFFRVSLARGVQSEL